MSKVTKTKIQKLLNDIEDPQVLNQVMEDVAFYAKKKDIIDDLSPAQLKELDKAIKEANEGKTIPWEEFKKELREWRKK